MTVGTYDDVAVALGRPISTQAERDQVSWWLSGVEMFIKARLGDVALLSQDALLYVEVEAVAAKVNRHGTRESSISVAVDDGTVTRRYESPVTAGDITDEWWNLLTPGDASGTYSTRPGFDADVAMWPVSSPPTYEPGWSDFR